MASRYVNNMTSQLIGSLLTPVLTRQGVQARTLKLYKQFGSRADVPNLDTPMSDVHGWSDGEKSNEGSHFSLQSIADGISIYPYSPLRKGFNRELAEGDRLPCVEGLNNFEPLKYLDWHIQIYGLASNDLEACAKSLDLAMFTFPFIPEILANGLIQDTAYLIQPDGYIGLVLPTQDIEQLVAYVNSQNFSTLNK